MGFYSYRNAAEAEACRAMAEKVANEETSQDFGKPTEVTETYWIYARNRTGRNNRQPGENCGKWLIFEPTNQIDVTWNLIKKEIENGELGFAAKVSTMKDKGLRDGMNEDPDFVICVYTYDHTDEQDVMRVRDRLKAIGFFRKLSYKTDEATLAGRYRCTVGGRVSKWRK